MYVRLITFHTRDDVTREHAAAVYDDLFGEMQKCRGFRGMSALINEDSKQAVSLSYWEDQQCATEAGSKILPVLMERVHDLVDRPPEVFGYELARQEMLPA